jgi:hypothetical protein
LQAKKSKEIPIRGATNLIKLDCIVGALVNEIYTVYYDISRDGVRLKLVFLVPFFLGFNFLSIYLYKDAVKLWLFASFSSFCMGLFFTLYSWQQFVQSCEVVRNGGYKIAEGVVTEFNVISDDNKETVTFKVSGQQFSYCNSMFIVGFNRTPREGGIIANAMNLKIFHFDNRILRIEIQGLS